MSQLPMAIAWSSFLGSSHTLLPPWGQGQAHPRDRAAHSSLSKVTPPALRCLSGSINKTLLETALAGARREQTR